MQLTVRRLTGISVVLVSLAAVGGVLYGLLTQEGAVADPANANVVLIGQDAEGVRRALLDAQEAAGFDLLVPAALPTEADRLGLVDVVVSPEGGSFRRIQLIYDAGEGSALEGGDSSLEYFHMPFRIDSPEGEPWAKNLVGWEMSRAIISVGDDGVPIRVTYTARSAENTLIMVFTGQQPSEAGLQEMLAGLRPLD